MNIKAIFPSGTGELFVHGLHQWDYGRKLEIHSDDLPALVEIHFACAGMQEAVVRTCSAVSGEAVASIPDLCLEQTAPIFAWVYAISGTEGATVKKITLPIIPRVRPQADPSIPRETSDAYTQFLTEVNKAIATLQHGDITVDNARTADSATQAETAHQADEAGALSSGDALATAETLDNLTRAGRYYCDWSVGTPTGTFGYVDVFVRYELTMQVFYDYVNNGDIYVRKKSGDTAWTEWKKGNAKEATSANFARLLHFDEYDSSLTNITEIGLYLVERKATNGDIFSEIIFVSDLNQNAFSSHSTGAWYSAYDKQIITNEGTILKVIRIGTYSVSVG